MTILEAILLGIVQGLTEFLPISSTAHLTITGNLLDVISRENPEQWTAFMAIIQMGTLVAVLIYFAKDVWEISQTFLRENLLNRVPFKEQTLNSRLGWYVIIGSLPVATVGLALKKVIEGEFTKDLHVIATSLIGLAIILFIAEKVAKFNKPLDSITWKDALIVGVAQTMALIPGSSRSGTTITAGLFLGMNRDVAARFSFLLSIPAIFGSGLIQFIQSLEYSGGFSLTTLIVATVVSGISGYASIAFLLRFLRSNSTNIFIIYRIVLGVLLFVLLGQGIL